MVTPVRYAPLWQITSDDLQDKKQYEATRQGPATVSTRGEMMRTQLYDALANLKFASPGGFHRVNEDFRSVLRPGWAKGERITAAAFVEKHIRWFDTSEVHEMPHIMWEYMHACLPNGEVLSPGVFVEVACHLANIVEEAGHAGSLSAFVGAATLLTKEMRTTDRGDGKAAETTPASSPSLATALQLDGR